MAGKSKLEQLTTTSEAAALLRAMADGLEQGTMSFGEGPVEIAGFRELKVGLKPAGVGQFVLKASLKFPKPGKDLACPHCGAQADVTDDDEEAALVLDRAGKPKYKPLKKQMKQAFKVIRLSLLNNQLPDAALVTRFLDDCELMVSYPGKGDEFYAAFTEEAARFKLAYEASDLDAMRTSAAVLDQMKRDCHSRYA